jgi:hypothetical protein
VLRGNLWNHSEKTFANQTYFGLDNKMKAINGKSDVSCKIIFQAANTTWCNLGTRTSKIKMRDYWFLPILLSLTSAIINDATFDAHRISSSL